MTLLLCHQSHVFGHTACMGFIMYTFWIACVLKLGILLLQTNIQSCLMKGHYQNSKKISE